MPNLMHLTNKIALVVFFAYVAIYLNQVLKQPNVGWDQLAYIACAELFHQSDIQVVHQTAYRAVEQGVSKEAYYELTHDVLEDDRGPRNYRAVMAANPDQFAQQLPFYQARVGFTGIIYLLNQLGIEYVKATAWLQVVSMFGVCVILIVWLSHYFIGAISSLVGIFILTMFQILPIAKNVGADVLSGSLVFLAIYLILERDHLLLGCWLLVFSLLVRADNIVFCGILFPVLVWSSYRNHEGINIGVILCTVAALILYIGLNLWSSHYGWWQLFHYTFVASNNTPAEVFPVFSLSLYIKTVLKEAAENFTAHPTISLLILFSMLYLLVTPLKQSLQSKRGLMVFSMLLTVAIHFLLFPSGSSRFFFAFYLVSAVIFISQLAKYIAYPHILKLRMAENVTAPF